MTLAILALLLLSHLDLLKNRRGEPVQYRPVTVAAMLKAGPATYPEGAAGELDGWIIAKHHEGPEACNRWSRTRRDWHVLIGATRTSPTSRGVVVEVTPNIPLAIPPVGTHVRVRGWALYDAHHVNGRGRGTAQELHPVTSIVAIP